MVRDRTALSQMFHDSATISMELTSDASALVALRSETELMSRYNQRFVGLITAKTDGLRLAR